MTTLSPPLSVIYDGDMGGDDIWSIMMMLGHPDKFDIKGITTLFGNVDCDHATQNILDTLAHFNMSHIPVYQGANKPFQGECMFGDGAYGDDGVGGVILNRDPALKAKPNAAEFIIDTILNSAEPITIFATGPCTNIAHALTQRPEIKSNIKSIILMGGGLEPGPHPDKAGRSGNITYHAEFNFFQDPYAANIVFKSGIETHVLTMDSNQYLHLDPEKKKRVDAITVMNLGQVMNAMLAPSEALDRPKFGVNGPFIHDPNVIIYALRPELYEVKRGVVTIEEVPNETVPMSEMRHGKMHATWNDTSNTYIAIKMLDAEKVFEEMVNAFELFTKR
jgi:inosine-uridine nucleoside N-ribohydrolase